MIPVTQFTKATDEVVERVCEKHGFYVAKRVKIFGQEIESNCPHCDEERVAQEQAEQENNASDIGAMRFTAMNIEPEFYHATFANFRAETHSQEAALDACRRMVSEKKGEVLLCGPNGVGKTHLACATAKELGGAVYTMYEIGCRIRHTYTPLAVEAELDVVKKLASLPFLAIDEVGRTKGGDAEKSWLSYIVDKRHVRFLPTLLLSNRPLERNLSKEDAQYSLESFLDSDIVSRFRGGVIIEINGQDARRGN